MSKLLALIIAVGLALGCDDQVVRDKVDAVLDHGIVAASVDCATTTSAGSFDGYNLAISYRKMLEGSLLVSSPEPSPLGVWTPAAHFPLRFFPRGYAVDLSAASAPAAGANCVATHEVEGGEWTVTLTGSCGIGVPYVWSVVDLDTCTGFNLEAFD